MAKCCIGIGKCSSFYKYLFGCIFFNIIKEIIKDFCPVLKEKQLMQTIFKNFGYLLFGIIFYIILKKRTKTRNNIIINKDILKEIKEDDRKYSQLIYNDYRQNVKISEIDKYTLFLVAINYVIYYECLKILNYIGFTGIGFWNFEIIFLFILTHFYFPKSNYKHQIISMIFIIIINTFSLIFYINLFLNNYLSFILISII